MKNESFLQVELYTMFLKYMDEAILITTERLTRYFPVLIVLLFFLFHFLKITDGKKNVTVCI